MSNQIRRGLALGLLFGVVYALADSLLTFAAANHLMRIALDPFSQTTVQLMTWTVELSVLIGLLVSVAGGRRLERRPYLSVVVMGMCLVAVAAPLAPAANLFGLSVGGIIAGAVLTMALYWLFGHRPLLAVMTFPVLAGLWYFAVGYGVPRHEPPVADPNRPIPGQKAPNILWVVFDTTRADHLAMYGYKRDTAPNLEKLAKDGVVFDRAYATAPWTVESHAAMFTGRYASQHWCNHEHLFLDTSNTTLSDVLSSAGYETAIFAGNPWLDEMTGLVRGFTHISPSWRNFNFTLYNLSAVGRLRVWFIAGGQDKGGKASNEGFKQWLTRERDTRRPFFAFINYLEAHAPYHDVPLEDRNRFMLDGVSNREAEGISKAFMNKMATGNDFVATPREVEIAHAMYDGGIYNEDRRLGEVVEMLRSAGQLENTLIIVNSDHGELFGEHGIYGHDPALYHPLVHVPLVMRLPGVVPEGAHIDKPVQLIDLFPTILELTGVRTPHPEVLRGQSLIPVLAGGGDPERPVFAEYFAPSMPPLIKEIQKMGLDPKTFRLKSAQVRDWRLIRWPGNRDEVFDLSTDPGETRDLSAERPAEAQMLKGVLERFIRENPARDSAGAGAVPEMDAATKEKLKSLGYVQ